MGHMEVTNQLTLVQQKKLQWAQEREMLSRLSSPWGKGKATVSTSTLPPIVGSVASLREDGETSGYQSEATVDTSRRSRSPPSSLPRGSPWAAAMRRSSRLGYSGSRSDDERRARWGDRGIGVGHLWEPAAAPGARLPPAAPEAAPRPPPHWVRRGLSRLLAAEIVSNTECSSYYYIPGEATALVHHLEDEEEEDEEDMEEAARHSRIWERWQQQQQQRRRRRRRSTKGNGDDGPGPDVASRVLTPTKFRGVTSRQSRDRGTQTEARWLTRGRRNVSLATGSDNESSSKGSPPEEGTMKIRSRSEGRCPLGQEPRPQWGANRPRQQYQKQSEKDPHYQRRLRRRLRPTATNNAAQKGNPSREVQVAEDASSGSSSRDVSPAPRATKPKPVATKPTKSLPSMPVPSCRSLSPSVPTIRQRLLLEEEIACRPLSTSSAPGANSESQQPTHLLLRLSSLRKGLNQQQRQWGRPESPPHGGVSS